MRSLKQFLVFLTAIAVIGVIGLHTGNAEDKTWTYDGVEYRIPKPAQDLQLPGDVPESHTVISGDCLWSISGTYLTDPYLWPLVWEEISILLQIPIGSIPATSSGCPEEL